MGPYENDSKNATIDRHPERLIYKFEESVKPKNYDDISHARMPLRQSRIGPEFRTHNESLNPDLMVTQKSHLA